MKKILSLLALSLSLTVFAGNWPGWRGNNTSGISETHKLPETWVKDGNIQSLWRLPIPGEGKSSPVVWDNTIFLTSAITENLKTQIVLYSIDKKTGEMGWTTKITDVSGTTHGDNGYASSTVTTDGERVYVFSGFNQARLVAVDFVTGKVLWKKDLGSLPHIYGSASSPILHENLVLQVCDGANGSYLGAFDKVTGSTVWYTPRKSVGSWSVPVIFGKHSKKPLVIVNGGSETAESTGRIAAYDLETGKLRWEVPGMTSYVCPAPILGGERIFCSSGRYKGPVFSLRGDSTLAWNLETAGPYIPTGIYYRERLYMISDDAVLSSYDPHARAGEFEAANKIWMKRIGTEAKASLVAGDDKIYVTTSSGNVSVVEASDKFRLISKNEMGEAIYATPAISEGRLYIRTTKNLYAIGDEVAVPR